MKFRFITQLSGVEMEKRWAVYNLARFQVRYNIINKDINIPLGYGVSNIYY